MPFQNGLKYVIHRFEIRKKNWPWLQSKLRALKITTNLSALRETMKLRARKHVMKTRHILFIDGKYPKICFWGRKWPAVNVWENNKFVLLQNSINTRRIQRKKADCNEILQPVINKQRIYSCIFFQLFCYNIYWLCKFLAISANHVEFRLFYQNKRVGT